MLRRLSRFWAKLAQGELLWHKPFTRSLDESNAPFYKWFEDGELNVSYNCLDRNLENGNAEKTAIIFEADDGAVTRVTYRELYHRVCRFAKAEVVGYQEGDRVTSTCRVDRGRRCHAGMRASRRHPLRCLRRIFGQVAA